MRWKIQNNVNYIICGLRQNDDHLLTGGRTPEGSRGIELIMAPQSYCRNGERI